MTPQTKTRLRNWITTIAALLSALGWSAAKFDLRYVHQSAYDAHMALDSVRRVTDSLFRVQLLVKVDSTNLRLRQIRCGGTINEGCR